MSKILSVLEGQKSDIPPIWFMRQAGRHLPVYLEVRATAKDFIDFCFTPEKAAKAVIYMAVSDDYKGKTNEYLHMFNKKEMDPKVYIPEEGSKLWDKTYNLLNSIDTKTVPLNIKGL